MEKLEIHKVVVLVIFFFAVAFGIGYLQGSYDTYKFVSMVVKDYLSISIDPFLMEKYIHYLNIKGVYVQ